MKTGILDRSRIVANTLMILLVAMNIYFSIQYSAEVRENAARQQEEQNRSAERIQQAKFIKLFVDNVLGTSGVISFDDRVKLESDIRNLNDAKALDMWNSFVNSADSVEAQQNAVELMSYLSSKMI